MPSVIDLPRAANTAPTTQPGRLVSPSRVDPSQQPFTFEQELELFGSWSSEQIWVPPKDSASQLAESMLAKFGCLASKEQCWEATIEEHQENFTQVREIDIHKASIRLPKGKLFVSVLEKERFNEIEDHVPKCVQTRLDEFLNGPGREPGVRVYYLKPLCVEVEDKLIFTERADVLAAIEKIKDEVFADYRRGYMFYRPRRAMLKMLDLSLSLPRYVLKAALERRQKAVDAYQAQLEFKRRKTALRAAKLHRRLRTDGCTFDDMLDLTNELERTDVIEQYAAEKELSNAAKKRLLKTAIGALPWFVALSITASYLASLSIPIGAPLVVCDPAFVAEMPGAPGKLLKIGHFDEVAGVTHVEI
ncbi:MAG: hypothetical protein AAF483_01560 [Planctomycetota bacterium]